MKQLIVSMLLVAIMQLLQAQPVNNHGQLKVSGINLVDQHNKPVILNGVSFGWSCFHPRFYTAGAVAWLHKDWRCNVVRVALGVEPKGGYIQDSARSINLVKTVVEAAIKEGIYVIIDWHSHNINLQESKQFFKMMATAYGNYPNIIYEIYNEPDFETWPEVKAYSEEIISVIRAIDTNNIILVGSPHWDQDILLPAEDPIKGYDNLMYTVHFYAATHKKELRDKTDAAMAKGLPIFISESAGMEATGDGNINNQEWQEWINWMSKHNLSWVTWSVSDKNETCSMLNTSAASDGNWKPEDLKESGVKTRAYIRGENKK